MKEFTHDEKVALLREFDADGFDKAWSEIEEVAILPLCLHEEKHEDQRTKYNLLRIECEDISNAEHRADYMMGELPNNRTRPAYTRFVSEIHASTASYLLLIDEAVVRWMWPQYCNAQSGATLELPELGDVV